MFGHAFEVTALENAPALLVDLDHSPESERLIGKLKELNTFQWGEPKDFGSLEHPKLLETGYTAIVTIPEGWGKGTADGDPKSVQLAVDGTDTTTAQEL